MMRLTTLAATLALLTTGTLADASADCGSAPQDTWMSQDQIQAKILEAGYTIDRFEVDDDCYEIYGRNSDGQEVEVYFHPVTGEIVKEDIDD